MLATFLNVALAAAVCADTPTANPWPIWIGRAEATLAHADGYTVTYHKQERIDGILEPAQTMFLKFKKPFSVYLQWINPGGTGGEAIYTEGANKDRIRVHPGGIWKFLTFNLNPHGRIVMRHSRHLVTDTGLERLVTIIGDNVRRAMAAGELESVDHGSVVIFGRPAHVYEADLPADPAKGYYCRRCIVYVDDANGLPLNVRNYDASLNLIEEYGFESFQPENNLTAFDFDSRNPHYHF